MLLLFQSISGTEKTPPSRFPQKKHHYSKLPTNNVITGVENGPPRPFCSSSFPSEADLLSVNLENDKEPSGVRSNTRQINGSLRFHCPPLPSLPLFLLLFLSQSRAFPPFYALAGSIYVAGADRRDGCPSIDHPHSRKSWQNEMSLVPRKGELGVGECREKR